MTSENELMGAPLRRLALAGIFSLAGLVAFQGCDVSEPNNPFPGKDDSGVVDPGDKDAGNTGPKDAGPLYAISTQVYGNMGAATTTVALVDDATTPRDISIAGGVSFGGRGNIFGLPGTGYFFTGSNEGPTITRYAVGADGKAAKSCTADSPPACSISFGAKGVTSIEPYPGIFQFVSETKAYYFDYLAPQVIIWNPKEMTITGTIPLTDYKRDGWIASMATSAVKRGTDIVFTVSYFKKAPNEEYDKTVALGFLDTTKDTVSAPVWDTRCSFAAVPVVLPSGDIYYASEVYTAAVKYIYGEARGGPSCVLRVKAGARDFDKTYVFNIEEVTKAPAGSLHPGYGSRAYVRTLDLSAYKVGSATSPGRLIMQPVWRWKEIDLASALPTATDVAGTGLSAARVLIYSFDGKDWTNETKADFSKSTLVDLSAPGGAKNGISILGNPFNVIRLR